MADEVHTLTRECDLNGRGMTELFDSAHEGSSGSEVIRIVTKLEGSTSQALKVL